MNIVLLIDRLLLATIFLLSGVAKLVDRSGSRQALLDFGVPAGLVAPSAVLLPFAELTVAGSLIPTLSAWWGALGALVLLLLFTAVVVYHLRKGHTPSCHCFGQVSNEPIGWPIVARNLILSALAGLIVSLGRTSTGIDILGWLGATTVLQRVELGLGLALVLLTVGGVALVWVSRKFKDLLQRVQELETQQGISGSKRTTERVLPNLAGTPAPAFRLPDLKGEFITLSTLLAGGKPLLLIFSHPKCKNCEALWPEVGRWQRNYENKLVLALISQDTPQANRAKASQHGIDLVLLQQDREVAQAYQAPGTPCAVLIRSDGTIERGLVRSTEQIQELVAYAVDMVSS